MPNPHKPGKSPRASAVSGAARRRLRALRLANGMSQTELARRTNMAASTLSRSNPVTVI